jgi:hypothetical protein
MLRPLGSRAMVARQVACLHQMKNPPLLKTPENFRAVCVDMTWQPPAPSLLLQSFVQTVDNVTSTDEGVPISTLRLLFQVVDTLNARFAADNGRDMQLMHFQYDLYKEARSSLQMRFADTLRQLESGHNLRPRKRRLSRS